MEQGKGTPRRKRPRPRRDVGGWTLQDIELELGAPVEGAERLMVVTDLKRRVEDVRRRLNRLAADVDRLDAAAQEAIIERGEDPRAYDLDPDELPAPPEAAGPAAAPGSGTADAA